MTNSHTFSAQLRTLLGKKVKQLRSTGFLPANIINGAEGSVAVSIPTQKFIKLFREVGETGLVYLEVETEKKARPVLIEDISVEPVSGVPTHVVFKQVNLKEKIAAEVPIETVGEFSLANATLIQVADSVEVEALPTDLPEKFVVDIATLTEVGQSITFAQLEFDHSKITLKIADEELESPIVLVQELKEEVVEEEPSEEVAAEPTTATEAAEPATEEKAE